MKRARTSCVALVFLFLLGGCASSSSTTASNAVYNAGFVSGALSFKAVLTQETIGGKVFPGDKDLVGTFTVDPANNKAYWDKEEIILLERIMITGLGGSCYFFAPSHACVICAGPGWLTRKKSTIYLFSRFEGVGLDNSDRYEADIGLFGALAQLSFPTDKVALFPSSKWVDGSLIPLMTLSMAGTFEVQENHLLLDGIDAQAYLMSEGDGSKYIAIFNRKRCLMVWANGGWYSYPINDPSLALSGMSDKLMRYYLRLRNSAQSSIDNAPQRNLSVPESVKSRMRTF